MTELLNISQFETKAAARLWVKAQWPLLNWTVLAEQMGGYWANAMADSASRLNQPVKNIHWLAYKAITGEADLSAAIALMVASTGIAASHLWLPKVQGQHLIAGQYSRTIPGAYGIAEPVDNLTNQWVGLNPLVLLIPCLAMSKTGYRLGRGKGYYDRLLAMLTQLDVKFLAIGVCPQTMVCHWPNDSWDVALHGHLSETGIQWF